MLLKHSNNFLFYIIQILKTKQLSDAFSDKAQKNIK
jgi:hypothetical protein